MPDNSSRGFFDAPPKTTFVMGLLTGLVVASIVGGIVFLTRGDSETTADEKVAGAENTVNTNAAAGDSRLSASNIAKYANELKLDAGKFNDCLNNETKAEKVATDSNKGVEDGVQGTPATFINGYLVSGALPYNEFKTIIDEVLAGKTPTSQYVTEGGPVDIEVTDEDHILGDKNAKVTLVEYSDFECPYCQNHAPTLEQLVNGHNGQVRLVFRHFPLSFHANAQIAAEAAECAGDQDMFWEMHDKLFGI